LSKVDPLTSVATDEPDSVVEISNRQRILNSAIEEFAAHGFKGARIDQIAVRCGINKQLIYHYFGSKELVFQAAMKYMITRPFASGPIESLEELFRNEDDFQDLNAWFRLLAWEGLQYQGEDIPLIQERRDSFGQVLSMIESLQASGKLDPRLDPQMVNMLITLASTAPSAFPQLALIVTGEEPSSQNFKRRMRELLLAILK
jgi:TetR/AcrR family transcriptional regulator